MYRLRDHPRTLPSQTSRSQCGFLSAAGKGDAGLGEAQTQIRACVDLVEHTCSQICPFIFLFRLASYQLVHIHPIDLVGSQKIHKADQGYRVSLSKSGCFAILLSVGLLIPVLAVIPSIVTRLFSGNSIFFGSSRKGVGQAWPSQVRFQFVHGSRALLPRPYSALSASTGSMPAARRAGATPAMMPITTATPSASSAKCKGV